MLFGDFFSNNYKYGIAASTLAINETNKFIFIYGLF